MKFKPAKDYKNLLIQANALATLVYSLEAILKHTGDTGQLKYENSILTQLLESEKDMNAQLTEELEMYSNHGEIE